jgi:glycosyltransferase involved in cell wall biosynthesis
MKNILFIHQSADLYGSDKTLLTLLKDLDRKSFNPIVIIPLDGPLKKELEKESIKVVIAPVIKLYRKMFSPINLFIFFRDIFKGLKIASDLHKEYDFQIVYSNTLAVLLGMFFAIQKKVTHIWHVHEIIEKPIIFKKIFFKFFALKSTTKIIYNSNTTADFWNYNQKIKNKSQVVWNGVDFQNNIISTNEINEIKNSLFQVKNELIIGLVGRISSWKGQLLLLETFEKLQQKNDNLKLVFVGSTPPNQEIFLEKLNQKITEFNLETKVIIVPFQKDIQLVWNAIDIAVVPSIEPEPFGLVAVEAMLAKKPVVGSNHGGLTEIIANNETGLLVKPNDIEELYKAIEFFINNPIKREEFGNMGFKRAKDLFSTEKYIQSLEKLFHEITTLE